jgi:nicotinamidase/pyrazinamidase
VIALDPATDILGLIDIQPTFMPGGALAVPEGEAVVAVANRLLRGPFRHAFATQDWHPPSHHSFAAAHPGRMPYDTVDLAYGAQTLWPDHGMQGTDEAALHPELDQSRIETVIRKGFRPEVDSYSAFFENDRKTATGLAGYLRERGFKRLFLLGLAMDFCVAYSAEDGADLGFEVYVVEDGCRAIALPLPDGTTTLDAARARLLVKGVRFIASSEIQPLA